MKKKDYLFILSNGRVAAINKKDGAIIWEVKLKEYLSSKMTLTYGQIAVEDEYDSGLCTGLCQMPLLLRTATWTRFDEIHLLNLNARKVRPATV